MKTENISLIIIPVIIVLLLAFTYDENGFSFDGDTNSLFNESEDGAQARYSNYENEFDALMEFYENAHQEEQTRFQESIQEKWGEFKTSSSTQWVSYIEKDNIRRTVDYATGEVSVEILLGNRTIIPENVKNKLKKEVYNLLSTTEADAFEADQVAQRVEARLPTNHRMIKRGKPSHKYIFDVDNLPPISFNSTGIHNVSRHRSRVAVSKIRKAKASGKHIAQTRLTVDKEILQKANQYAESVSKAAKKQKISTSLIYAVMEAESSFNPLAKSHIPAYGLMQIVPRTAGKDASKHLYGRAKVLAPSFLYSTQNNISIGAAYIHVLYYKYLRRVKNQQSRLYCTIAAYNTGASNVARAFIRQKNFYRATKKINKLSSNQVYRKLAKKLPFRETRKYLKKVTRNMAKYINARSKKSSA